MEVMKEEIVVLQEFQEAVLILEMEMVVAQEDKDFLILHGHSGSVAFKITFEGIWPQER